MKYLLIGVVLSFPVTVTAEDARTIVAALNDPQGCNGMDRSLSHNGLTLGQNGYTITREREDPRCTVQHWG